MSSAHADVALATAQDESNNACLHALADHLPLSLLVDLALPTTPAEYEEVRDEQGDTSWLPSGPAGPTDAQA